MPCAQGSRTGKPEHRAKDRDEPVALESIEKIAAEEAPACLHRSSVSCSSLGHANMNASQLHQNEFAKSLKIHAVWCDGPVRCGQYDRS